MYRRNAASTTGVDTIASFFRLRSRAISLTFWVLALAAIPLWIHFDKPGWDIVFYRNAITALQAGHDPYLDAMAVQRAFHATLAQHPNDTPPYSYVYSPMTLPLLRLLGSLPVWFSGSLYWLAVALGAFVPVFVMLRVKAEPDADFFRIVAPVAIFFPGLIAQDTVLSGNVAFVLYGLVLLGAYFGWWRNRWLWCYAAILIASVFKAPLLCLVVIPLFSARKQWLPATITGFLGSALFAIQALLWPSLFHHFLQAVELQFSYNRDFGSSPAGVFSYIITGHGISYSPASEIFYLAYAIVIFATLFHLSRKFLAGVFTLSQWVPVLLLGAVMLNPRLMEYDLAPLALPMALIGWRFTRRLSDSSAAVAIYFSIFLAANLIGAGINGCWKPTECILLVASFVAGCWTLLHPAPDASSTTTLNETHAVKMA
jgi:hypothetical protein